MELRPRRTPKAENGQVIHWQSTSAERLEVRWVEAVYAVRVDAGRVLRIHSHQDSNGFDLAKGP
jgi:hypothetical protein